MVPTTFAQSRKAVPAAAPSVRHVIIISVDSMMPETYLHPGRYGLKVPHLREIAGNGAYSEGARGVLPTVTYPSHTSIVTGANPATHGIFTNRVDDPDGTAGDYMRWYAEDIRVPTIYQVAKAKGLRTGIIYWPVTVGAKADGIVPEFWRGEDGKTEDAKLSRAMSTPGLLEAVARRFPDFSKGFNPPRVGDAPSADVAVHLIETLKPNLLLLHMFEVDHTTHNEGIFSEKAKEAIEIADAQIGRVIEAAKRAGTWARTALVIVSDHGMASHQRRLRPGVWMKEAGLVTLNDRNRVASQRAWLSSSSGTGYIYLMDENDEAAKRKLVELFQSKMKEPNPRIVRMYTRDEIRAVGGDPRAFLALECAPGFEISFGYSGEADSAASGKAHHGHHPENPAMLASLLFYGPSIAPGKIENARLIDVAPTVAPWLGLKMEKAEGKPLAVPRRTRQTRSKP